MSRNNMIDKYKTFPIQLRASFWFLICSFLQRGISVISTPIFTRLLSTVEYGQYTVFDSWLKIITIFVSLNLYGGVYTQGLIKFSSDRRSFSSSIQGLTITLVAGWTVVYLVKRSFWNSLFSLTTVQMFAMLVMIWASSAFNFWAGEQRVEYKYQRLIIATLIVSIAKPAIGIACVKFATDKVTARILGLAIVELVCYIGCFVVQMNNGKLFYSTKYWKHALSFNIPLIPHYLSQSVLNSADRIMIQKMVGDSEAGIYGLAYSISLIMMLFNNALMQTISPWMYQQIKDRNEDTIAPIAYITLILIAGVNILLILLAPEMLTFFAPKSYHNAIWIIPPVAMSVYFLYSYDLFAKFAFYHEKTNVIMIASVSGALLNIALNYVFISMFGYVAAGYTTLICYIIYSLLHYVFMNKVCCECGNGKQPYKTNIIFAISISFILIGLSLMLTYEYPVIRYGIVLLAIFVVFLLRVKIVYAIKNITSLRLANKK